MNSWLLFFCGSSKTSSLSFSGANATSYSAILIRPHWLALHRLRPCWVDPHMQHSSVLMSFLRENMGSLPPKHDTRFASGPLHICSDKLSSRNFGMLHKGVGRVSTAIRDPRTSISGRCTAIQIEYNDFLEQYSTIQSFGGSSCAP